jgi:hypothetical protein
VLNEVANRYGREQEPFLLARKSPDYRSHESYLLASSFSVLEQVSVFLRKPITIEEVLGRALSMSTCSPQKLGVRLGAFEAELRNALAGRGELTEIANLAALIARRP